MLKSGQRWTLQPQLGQLNSGQGGKGMLRSHLCCPNNLPRLWERKEKRTSKKKIGKMKS